MILSWEQRVTTTGVRYWDLLRPEMPRIPDSYVDSLVYIYRSKKAARRGERAGGCGFLIGVKFRGVSGLHHVYVVTNAHVEKTFRVVRYNSRGLPQCADLRKSRWLSHPDGSDVGVCPLGFSSFFDDRVTMIPSAVFVTKKLVRTIPFRHGDELFMVSRYMGHPGDDENEPVVRFGTLAKPQPVTVDGQESFLAEMHSLRGHSGSPTFLYFYGTQPRLGADTVKTLPKPKIHLLGVNWGYMPEMSLVRKRRKDALVPTKFYAENNSGFATIVPAWKISEILNCPELKQERQQIERALTEPHQEAHAVPGAATSPGAPRLVALERGE